MKPQATSEPHPTSAPYNPPCPVCGTQHNGPPDLSCPSCGWRLHDAVPDLLLIELRREFGWDAGLRAFDIVGHNLFPRIPPSSYEAIFGRHFALPPRSST